MADLGKITPTKPVWSRIDATVPEENNSHPQQHPEKREDKNRGAGETPEEHKRPTDPDDEHEVDLFV